MTKEYVINSIKNNKTTSLSIAMTSFLATFLLSTLTGFFYNLYRDDVIRGATHSKETILLGTFILLIAMISLILMIHNVFATTMNSRLHQLGILKSVGATPKQIKKFLTLEVLTLSLIPILLGAIAGILSTFLIMQIIIHSTEMSRDYELTFQYHPLILLETIIMSIVTVGISSWIPARKISKLSIMETIFYRDKTKVKKMKKFPVFSNILGIEGQLARKSIYARRKSFKTSTVSFVCASLSLITFLNMETISGLSTKRTYFERYKDKWDIMWELEEGDKNEILKEMRNIEGVKSCIVYEKYDYYAELSPTSISKEVQKLGGLEIVSLEITKKENGNYIIGIPVIILDNDSFQEYYKTTQNNRLPLSREDEIITINKIWSSKNHDLKGNYIPYIKEQEPLTLKLYKDEKLTGEGKEVNIHNYSEELPELKEEYNRYEAQLVQIMSEDYAKMLKDNTEQEPIYFNVKVENEEEINDVQEKIENKLQGKKYEIQNRVEEEKAEVKMRKGFKTVVTILASLLACIGLSNVFSNTLSQMMQRRREFARYMSIGLSPKGMKKMLRYESSLISLKPIIISILINIPITFMMLDTSTIPLQEFLKNASIIPIVIYTVFVYLMVKVAYKIGSKKMLNREIIDILKDDTLY